MFTLRTPKASFVQSRRLDVLYFKDVQKVLEVWPKKINFSRTKHAATASPLFCSNSNKMVFFSSTSRCFFNQTRKRAFSSSINCQSFRFMKSSRASHLPNFTKSSSIPYEIPLITSSISLTNSSKCLSSTADMSMNIIEVETDEELERIINEENAVVLVDFYAELSILFFQVHNRWTSESGF